MKPHGPLVVIAGAFLLVTAACADDGTGGVTREDADLVHVHDVLVPTDGGEVMLAAHTGLYAIRDGELVPVGERFDDLMSAAVEADGTIIASGHPDLRSGDLRMEGKPPLLGLVESADGSSWTSRSLLGETDFHALIVRDGLIIGADSTSERVLVSADGGHQWAERDGKAQLVDMVVDPSDGNRLVGLDLDRGLLESSDGGNSWSQREGPALVDLVWTADGLLGFDEEDDLWRAPSDSLLWTRTGRSIEGIEALGVGQASVYAFASPDQLLVSADHGETWKDAS